MLSGSAVFFGPRGEEMHRGPLEGIMLPVGCFYRFHATSQQPLVLLRVGARTAPGAKGRLNVYGDPLPAESKENGRVDVIVKEGEYWGRARAIASCGAKARRETSPGTIQRHRQHAAMLQVRVGDHS